MFKTFTSAALAAYASAANEVNNFNNTYTTLIPDKLMLHLYYAYNATNIANELHSELIWAKEIGLYSPNARKVRFCVREVR